MEEIEAAVEALNRAVLKNYNVDTEIHLHGWGARAGSRDYLRPQGDLKVSFHGRAA